MLKLLYQDHPNYVKLRRNPKIYGEIDKKIAKIGGLLRESFLITDVY